MPKSATDHGPIVVKRTKGKAKAWSEIVLVRQELGFTIQITKGEIGSDLLKKCLGIGVLLGIEQSTLPIAKFRIENWSQTRELFGDLIELVA